MRLLRTTGTLLFAALSALAASGCSFITGVRSVSRVTVTVSPATISIGQIAIAFGTAFDGNTALTGTNSRYNVTFTSRNAAVATVNPTSGQVIGIGNGTTYIIGVNGGKQDSAMITVQPVQARQVIINSTTGTRTPIFRLGALNGLNATIFDSTNNVLRDRTIAWTARTPTVLTITNVGVVTPLAVGTSWVVASVDNGPGNKPAVDSVLATVTVPPAISVRITPNNDNNYVPTVYLGQTQPFTATVTDSLRNVTTRRVVWSTGDRGSVLAIDSLTGLATPIAATPYNTSVTASVDVVPGYPLLGSVTSSVTVSVLAPASTVQVSNSAGTTITTITVAAGSTTALTVTALDAVKNSLFNRNFRLTSSNTAVATVPATSSGSTQLSAIATGTTTITVQALDVNGAAQGSPATLTVTVQ